MRKNYLTTLILLTLINPTGALASESSEPAQTQQLSDSVLSNIFHKISASTEMLRALLANPEYMPRLRFTAQGGNALATEVLDFTLKNGRKEIIDVASNSESELEILMLIYMLGYQPIILHNYVFVKSTVTTGDLDECDTYKIHLMPLDYSLETVYDLLRIFTDVGLERYATSIKFSKQLNNNHPISKYTGDNLACVVIYSHSKQAAQDILNLLYPALENIPGSGITPRYNAKVTDLMWVAQGNADFKKDREEDSVYEEPDAIYCRPDYPDPAHPKDHYLRHPLTGEALTSAISTP